jgi:hypothetical protein
VKIPDIGMIIKIYTAEIRQDEGDFSTELILAVQRLYVPFRHSTKVLNKLISLIQQVREVNSSGKESYDFKAVFVSGNPYLGLFLRRLRVSNSARLNVEYTDVEGANEAKVSVTKEKVSLMTKDLQSFQAFSKKYITLSSLDLSNV